MITEATGNAIRAAEGDLVRREPLAKAPRAAAYSCPVPNAAAQTAVNVAGQPPTSTSVLAEVHGNEHQPERLVDLPLAFAEDRSFQRVKEVA
jgi:hypothetical protein